MNRQFNDKKFQAGVIRFLMVDSQQITFNKIIQNIEQQSYTVQGKLLDDLNNFEKLLNLQWDVILYQSAYDFSYQQAFDIIDKKGKSIPVILLTQTNTYSSDAIKIYKSGIFDIASPNNLDYLNFSLLKAVSYSRLLKKEHKLSLEIDKLQQQSQTLVESTEHAVATFLEGVHVSANEQYAQLFNCSNVAELIGLPLLDILQPSDIITFKQYFKKLTKGDFSQANFDIKTQNSNAKQDILSLQFSATDFEEENALQLVIATEIKEVPSSVQHYVEPISQYASKIEVQTLLQKALDNKCYAALVLFVLDQVPNQLLADHWNSSTVYSEEIYSVLNLNFHQSILKLSDHVFCTSIAVDDDNSIHTVLSNYSNKLPKEVNALGKTYSVYAHLAYTVIKDKTEIHNFDQLINQAFTQNFDMTSAISLTPIEELPKEIEPVIDIPIFSFGEVISTSDAPSTHLVHHETYSEVERILEERIASNDIHLHFQQLYDKEDIDTHIYEITSSFKHNDQTIQLDDFASLRSNLDLAIKVDRWVLVEASKRLHQFLSKSPKARVVVNLHAATLNDSNMISLLTKLVNLINSKYSKPLILQFKEEDLMTNIGAATKFIQSVQEYGVGITISNFGQSVYATQLLEQFDLIYVKLATKFTQQLGSDDSMVELQEKLDTYKEISRGTKFLLPELDDMTAFANSWNVDVRYLQGAYFQSKQSEFIDSAA